MKPDAELLREFVETKSEAAFTQVVCRHLDFVYSCVLRQVGGDTHLAKDAAQLVFCDLARKASSLLDRSSISGWLYRAAHFAAAKIVRSERRRRVYEQEAALMRSMTPNESEPEWDEVRGLLDKAMLELNQCEREAILLRFFRKESFAEIGFKLKVPEDTARKRVARALDKLHALLARRGVASSAAGLATVLAQNSVHSAPEELPALIAHAAMNQTATAAGAWSFGQILMSSSPPKGIVAVIFSVALLGTGAVFYYSHSSRSEPPVAVVVHLNALDMTPPVTRSIEFESLTAPVAKSENPSSAALPATTLNAAAEATPPTDLPSPSRVASIDGEPLPLAPTTAANPVVISSQPLLSIPQSVPATSAAKIEGRHVMYVQQLKQWRLICDVERNVPYVLIDGHREEALSNLRDFGDPAIPSLYGNGIRLQPAKHFFPGLVRIENVEAQFISNRLSFRATFDSLAPLEHVYFAFEIVTNTDHHVFCLEELGKLSPHHPRPVSEKILFPNYVEVKSYKIYLFTGGVEIMHTRMTREEIAHGFDDLISFQLEHVPADKPEPLLAVTPEYPREMREKKTPGKATVAVRVTEQGRVENPRVVESSDPAFAAAALKVLGDWRFVPAVKNGRPISSTIELPFTFSP